MSINIELKLPFNCPICNNDLNKDCQIYTFTGHLYQEGDTQKFWLSGHNNSELQYIINCPCGAFMDNEGTILNGKI